MYLKLVLATCLLAFCAVVLSAYARLSDAGLGCTNWPACYEEKAFKERQSPQVGATQSGTGRGHTSWQWKLHSQVVQVLGFLAIAVCGLSWRKRKELRQSPLLPTLLLGLMVFFAAFGIWAFSHLPRPVIVQVHLAGGIAMLMLLTWIALRQIASADEADAGKARNWRTFCGLSPAPTGGIPARAASWLGVVLVVIQIMLGGWLSANFAALACTGLPLCNGSLLPPMDFSYSLANSGLPLSAERLTAMHWIHRVGALLTALYLGWLSFKVIPVKGLHKIGQVILGLVVLQSALGISNVLFGLPLAGAVLHNAIAMLLLVVLTLLNFKLQKRKI